LPAREEVSWDIKEKKGKINHGGGKPHPAITNVAKKNPVGLEKLFTVPETENPGVGETWGSK